MEKIINGTYTNSILLSDEQEIKWMPEYPCLIGELDMVVTQAWNGLVYQKDWQYTKLFNWHLGRIVREFGLYNRIKTQTMPRISHCEKSGLSPSNFLKTVSIFALIILGLLVATGVLAVEILVNISLKKLYKAQSSMK